MVEENIILLKYPFYNNIETEVFCRNDNDCIATESCKPESEHPRSDNSGKSQNKQIVTLLRPRFIIIEKLICNSYQI